MMPEITCHVIQDSFGKFFRDVNSIPPGFEGQLLGKISPDSICMLPTLRSYEITAFRE